MRRKTIIMSVIALATLFSILFLFMHGPQKIEEGVIIHLNNRYYTALPGEEGYDKLSEECMDILESINGQYKLAMTFDRLNSIKKWNNYVEIIFPENITVKASYKDIRVKGAVFMLSGEYRGIIFTYRGKIVGVWSSDRKFDILEKMVGMFVQ